MTISTLFDTIYRRILLASLLWLIAWPTWYFFKLGEIIGPKAWFWVIGELNYPIVAIAYMLIDGLLNQIGLKPWMVFTLAVVTIAACMPFYYKNFGFALGVSIEARLF